MTSSHHRGLVRVVAPASEPLTLAETKQFLRITHDDDDARISDMMQSARLLSEQWLKRSLITQSWKLIFEDELCDSAMLPMGPVQSVTLVATITEALVSTTVDSGQYALSAAKDRLVLASNLYAHRIEITYVAGFGNASQLPKPIKLGLLQHVASMVDGSAGLAPIPDNVLQYYMPYRELSL